MPMSYVCDMDGVIYNGSRLIPGALEFVQRLQFRGHKFLFLTKQLPVDAARPEAQARADGNLGR